MPDIKPDKRFKSYQELLVGGFAAAAFIGMVLGLAAAKHNSTALWIIVGVLIGSVALSGMWYSAWIFSYYRCPQCLCRLKPEQGPLPLRIRYHCKECDTIWDSGITWGGEER